MNNSKEIINVQVEASIKESIFSIRGQQVIADRDIAKLYGVTTSALNQAVKRNHKRFPERFMFQLTDEEFHKWKSQIVISKMSDSSFRMGLRTKPYVFTEHGVTMLAAVLKSQTAINISLSIIDAFIAMRRFISMNEDVFKRVQMLELRQNLDQEHNEAQFKKVFAALEEKKSSVQGVFFDGQLWDARMLIDEIIQTAKQSIILIDNWVSVSTLNMFASKNENVFLKIVTTPHRDKNGNLKQNISQEDVLKFNAQYPKLKIIFNNTFHDRFLIIDDRDLYLIGASLKDLGKKCFGFTQLDSCFISDIKKRIY